MKYQKKMGLSRSTKGQVIHYDFIIGFLLFGIVLGIFFSMYSPEKNNLEQDAIKISEQLMSENGILTEGRIDPDKIQQLKNTDYNDLKGILNSKSNFQILINKKEIGQFNSNAKNIVRINRIGILDNKLTKVSVITW